MQRKNMTRVQTAERRAFVLERKRAGDSHREVADKAEEQLSNDVLPKNWGKTYVSQDLRRVLEKRKETLDEEAEQYRTLMIERLQTLLNRIWPYTAAHKTEVVKQVSVVEDGKVVKQAKPIEITVPPDPKIVSRVLEIMDRLASFMGVEEAPEMPSNQKSQTNVFQQISEQYVKELG